MRPNNDCEVTSESDNAGLRRGVIYIHVLLGQRLRTGRSATPRGRGFRIKFLGQGLKGLAIVVTAGINVLLKVSKVSQFLCGPAISVCWAPGILT